MYLGFNEDERGRRVFDGIVSYAAGASGGFFNYRFAQPARTHRQRSGRWYAERQFPFAIQTLSGPPNEYMGTRKGRAIVRRK